MRERAAAFGLLVLGAVAMLVVAGLPWYDAGHQVTFSGTAVSGGLAQALGVAVLAGALLMLALRSRGRRVVAVMVGLIAVAAAVGTRGRPSSAEVLAELRKRTLADSYALTGTGAPIGYLVACAAVLAGAVLVLLRAHRWPQRAGRFERDAGAGAGAVGPEDDPATIWKALDAGQDPTAPSEAEPDPGDHRS